MGSEHGEKNPAINFWKAARCLLGGGLFPSAWCWSSAVTMAWFVAKRLLPLIAVSSDVTASSEEAPETPALWLRDLNIGKVNPYFPLHSECRKCKWQEQVLIPSQTTGKRVKLHFKFFPSVEVISSPMLLRDTYICILFLFHFPLMLRNADICKEGWRTKSLRATPSYPSVLTGSLATS